MAVGVEPAWSFTIPSLADDTPLDCRIYHPPHFEAVLANAAENGHPTRGAIVAHPYAPLGGNYDDAVVLALVKCLLREGFVVGTFNFRGAAGSKGSTSWSGRLEKEDFTSVTGFMVYYLQKLQPSEDDDDNGPKRLSTIISARTSRVDDAQSNENNNSDTSLPSSTTPTPQNNSQSNHTILLLSGYSYGSLILSRLPLIEEMLTRFENAPHGTTAAEIILRSYRLARESRSQSEIQQQQQQQQQQQHQIPPGARGRRLTTPSEIPKPRLRASTAVVVGGEETLPQERRRSGETSRGASIVRRSVEVPLRIKARVRRRSSGVLRHGSNNTGTREDAKTSEESLGVGAGAGAGAGAAAGLLSPRVSVAPDVSVRYLLVSPVLPPLAYTLVPPASWAGLKGGVEKGTGFGAMAWPTLVVWGSVDNFASNRRLKVWAERLGGRSAESEMFRWRDFEGAGHFWREAGVMKAMTGEVGEWIRGVS